MLWSTGICVMPKAAIRVAGRPKTGTATPLTVARTWTTARARVPLGSAAGGWPKACASRAINRASV